MSEEIPLKGYWPVDPQEDQELSDTRIWIDGCFDFFHHGHAGVMLQSRQLGTELYIGIHSDADILKHKGPTVMNLEERVSAANASRWCTKVIPYAPYVTSLPYISHYECRYVVHGDDITSDSNGEDCYRFVKAADRFKVVKRTPGISTTDLVGRMLLCTKEHFINSLRDELNGKKGDRDHTQRTAHGLELKERIKAYATDASGWKPWVDVYNIDPDHVDRPQCTSLFEGKKPQKNQRIVYVDGGFDLFSSGHIEFLRCVYGIEESKAHETGWYEPEACQRRIQEAGADYAPCYIVVGMHDDHVINKVKGMNYPIMNIIERGLCVLQCKYVHCLIFGAHLVPNRAYLAALPTGTPSVIYHGSTSSMPLAGLDPYGDARDLGIFSTVPPHAFQDVNAEQIVSRILHARERFEERQRRKGGKAVVEEEVKRTEKEKKMQVSL